MTGARRYLIAGGTCGLAWAAAMRGWMAQLAAGMPHTQSQVTWLTLVLVLLPGVAVGTLLGWAAYRRQAGLPPSRRLIFAPVIFASALLDPHIFVELIRNGTGGGSLIVVGTALSIGYAVTGKGWSVRRVFAGLIAVLGLLVIFGMGGLAAPLQTAHGAWVSALGFALVLVLGLASALPYAPTHGSLHRPAVVSLGALIGFTWAAGLCGLVAQLQTATESRWAVNPRSVWLVLYAASFTALLAWASRLLTPGSFPIAIGPEAGLGSPHEDSLHGHAGLGSHPPDGAAGQSTRRAGR